MFFADVRVVNYPPPLPATVRIETIPPPPRCGRSLWMTPIELNHRVQLRRISHILA